MMKLQVYDDEVAVADNKKPPLSIARQRRDDGDE
jgi:hypothetical protein